MSIRTRLRASREAMSPAQKNILFFSVEGSFFTLTTALGNSTNNLFLTRMGASAFQLSLFTMIAQILTMSALVPIAIYADRLRNKRPVVMALLIFIAGSYLLGALTPFFGGASLYLLIAFVAMAVSGINLCTTSWQGFFADVAAPDERNNIFATRNQVMFIVNICIPLTAGVILNFQGDDGSRVAVHQIYYILMALSAVTSAFFLTKVRGGTVKNPAGKTFRDFLDAVRALVKNKRFLFFAGVAFLFYAAWQLDGTLFFVGQTKYVGLSDFWYIVSTVCCGFAQFLSIRFWARLNEKKGVRFVLIFAGIGMVISPFCIIVPLFFEGAVRLVVHLLLRCLADLTFATVALNVLQNLLQVIEEKNRALSIAAYTIFIAIAQATFPMIGVSIYTALGADQTAIIQTFLMMACARVVALGGLIFRWWKLRKEPI